MSEFGIHTINNRNTKDFALPCYCPIPPCSTRVLLRARDACAEKMDSTTVFCELTFVRKTIWVVSKTPAKPRFSIRHVLLTFRAYGRGLQRWSVESNGQFAQCMLDTATAAAGTAVVRRTSTSRPYKQGVTSFPPSNQVWEQVINDTGCSESPTQRSRVRHSVCDCDDWTCSTSPRSRQRAI